MATRAQDPFSQEDERHARQMYCAAMSIPETVVRECWCTMEELFAGSVRREGVLVHTIDVDTGVPSKDSKVFVVKIQPGEDGAGLPRMMTSRYRTTTRSCPNMKHVPPGDDKSRRSVDILSVHIHHGSKARPGSNPFKTLHRVFLFFNRATSTRLD